MKNENKLSLMFIILTIASKSIGQANSLSKRVDWVERVEKDNENQVMLKKEWLNIRVVVATTRHSRTNDLTTSKALQWAIK